jgi:hypothetical protein
MIFSYLSFFFRYYLTLNIILCILILVVLFSTTNKN